MPPSAPAIEAAPESAADNTTAPVATRALAGHDFRSPVLLSAVEVRQLRVRHEEFARSLATRLSIYLRLEVGVTVAEICTSRYRKWLDSLAVPTHLTLFHLESLEGTALFEFPPRLALTVIDRLLGGKGMVADSARDLTEIEVALTDEVVQIVLREWCPHGTARSEAKPVLAGHENNARFVQTAANEANFLLLAFNITVNDCSERFTLALPLAMMSPVLEKLAPVPVVKPEVAVARVAPRWNQELDQVKVPLTAGWAGFEVSARHLAHLQVGDLLPIDPASANQVQVRLSQIPKFTGRLGAIGKDRAVEIIGLIRP